MARTDTLANFVTDVANAIREKSGKSDLISPSNFDTEIINLPSGGGSEPNIFIQEEEPETKEGLWIQASDLQVDNIVIDELVYVNEDWEDPTLIERITDNTAGQSTHCALVGDYLYYTGRNTAPTATNMFRLNIKTYMIEDLGKPKLDVQGKYPVVVGTDIYFMGYHAPYVNATMSKSFVKYDTLTNTYTQLASIDRETGIYTTYYYYNGFIYAFNVKDVNGTSQTNGYQLRHQYKYNIATDEWIYLGEDSYWYKSCSLPFLVGNKLWFLFHTARTAYFSNIANYSEYYRKSIVFDFETEQFIVPNVNFESITSGTTKINGASNSTTPQPVLVDDMVYLFTRLRLYKIPVSEFEIVDTEKILKFANYETLEYNSPLTTNKSYLGYIIPAVSDNKIFLTGLNNTEETEICVLPLTSKEFDNNTLVIRQGNSNGGAVLTQLFNMPLQKGRLTYPLYNAIHYTTENGANNSLPLYYGTGTEWVRFKN